MDQPSYGALSSSSSPGPPSPRANKVVLQRQYRLKEGECFDTLRDIVHKLTGEAPQTRYDILTKVIELLMTDPEARKSKEMRLTRLSAGCDMPSPIDFDNMMSDHRDYPLPSSSWYQLWCSTMEPGAQIASYYPQVSGQQYQVMSGTEATLNLGGYGEDERNFIH